MAHLSYEESIKRVYYGLTLLAIVTLVEVGISLLGKGHVPGLHGIKYLGWLVGILSLGIVILSIYKAYFIIYEFMHMKYEVKGLAYSVLLPTALLIWAIIAFFQEGNSWKERREYIQQKNMEQLDDAGPLEGMLDEETYPLQLTRG